MKKNKFTLGDSRKRLMLLGYLVLGAFLLVSVRLLWIQVVSGTELGKRAVTQVTETTSPRANMLASREVPP